MVESGLFQLACQNLHFSSIATLINSVVWWLCVFFSFFGPLDVRVWIICFLLGWWILGDCSSRCTLDGQNAGHAQEGDCHQRSSARPFQKRLSPLTTQQVFVHSIYITNLKIWFSFLQVPKSIGFSWNFLILSSVWITEDDIRNLHSDHGVFDLFRSFGSRWWRGGNGGREKLCQSRLMGDCLPKRGEVPQRDWGARGNACNWWCIGCWCNWEDTKGEFLWCYHLHCR